MNHFKRVNPDDALRRRRLAQPHATRDLQTPTLPRLRAWSPETAMPRCANRNADIAGFMQEASRLKKPSKIIAECPAISGTTSTT